jgi:hypothetical protein
VERPSQDSEALLARLRAYRSDLESRIAFLESGKAEVRLRHEGEWIDTTAMVVTTLYRQYGDLGALISDVAAGRI